MTKRKTLGERIQKMTQSPAYKARVLARKAYGGNIRLVLAFEAGYRAGKKDGKAKAMKACGWSNDWHLQSHRGVAGYAARARMGR